MDEQIIRTLQEQAIEERQYIQEKYGQDEDVVQVVNRRDYLTGRQSAAVRLYDNERNVPLHGARRDRVPFNPCKIRKNSISALQK